MALEIHNTFTKHSKIKTLKRPMVMTNKILSLFDKRLLSLKSQVIFEKQESDIVAVLLIDK